MKKNAVLACFTHQTHRIHHENSTQFSKQFSRHFPRHSSAPSPSKLSPQLAPLPSMKGVAPNTFDLKNTHAIRRPQSSTPDPNPPVPANSNPSRPQSPAPKPTPTYTRQLKPEAPPVSHPRPKPHIYPPAQARVTPNILSNPNPTYTSRLATSWWG